MGMPGSMRRRWRPGPDTAIAVVALVLAAGGVGWAASGLTRSSATITACENTTTGALRIPLSGSCDPNVETGSVVEHAGPPGTTGRSGASGGPFAPG
jgi:hypothetical protein